MSDTLKVPVLSATILLLRDQPDLQVLMVRRHYQIDFAAGALVFPGGKAHDEDQDPAWSLHCDGYTDCADQAARIAAIREAYEEAGVLLARPVSARGTGEALIGADIMDDLQPYRGPVDRREKPFLELISENNLVLALDCLIHFGHWITPEMMPKRFDTHFYIAAMPDDQTAENDGYETTEAVWLGPQAALDQAESGEATIIFPTRMNLGKLAETSCVDSALKRFSQEAVITVLPEVGQDSKGRPCLHIPEEAGYMQITEPLTKLAGIARKA